MCSIDEKGDTYFSFDEDALKHKVGDKLEDKIRLNTCIISITSK